jgi:hypothetical protein
MFKRLMSNPTWRAVLRDAITKAKKVAKSLGSKPGGCLAFALIGSAASVAAAGIDGGPDAAVQQAASEPVSLAQRAIVVGAVGAATHGGLAAGGVTVTGAGGAAVLGAGATLTVGGAVLAGGAITAVAGAGYVGGSVIGSITLGKRSFSENLGEGMYYIAPWAFNW